MPFCSACGNDLAESARFCPRRPAPGKTAACAFNSICTGPELTTSPDRESNSQRSVRSTSRREPLRPNNSSSTSSKKLFPPSLAASLDARMVKTWRPPSDLV